MTNEIIAFINKVAKTKKILLPVFDFGGMLAVEQEAEFGGLIKKAFGTDKFFTFDSRLGADFVGDVQDTTLPDNSVGTALLLETLEHLPYPQKAITELERILKPGGLLVVTTLMCWEEHRCPVDYWRFLPQGLELLFKDAGLTEIDIIQNGCPSTPSSVYGMGRKKS